MKLSVLCVSDMKPRALPLIEQMRAAAERLGAEFVLARDGVDVHSKGYIESVLDDAVALTTGEYVLRLDDDERISLAMEQWLADEKYLVSDNWSFPRVHFWGDNHTVILEKYYYPDVQTRLATRVKSFGRTEIHAASPFGGGLNAPCALEHWVYLVKTYEERIETAKRYIAVKFGSDGGQYRASAIEDEFAGDVHFIDYTDGKVPLRGKTRLGQLR